MRNETRLQSIICVAIMLFVSCYASAGTWTTLDNPRATGPNGTAVQGIDGGNLVGWYDDTSGDVRRNGFIYNGTTWTTFNAPGAGGTVINGIDGSNFVGNADGHGFLYDGTTWTTIDVIGATETTVQGVDGSNLVGRYHDASGQYHGFIYNIDTQSFNTIDKLGATGHKLQWC